MVLAHVLQTRCVTGSVIELGCGTGLAAMVCSRLGCVVSVQELSDVLPFTIEAFGANNIVAHACIGARWGADFVSQAELAGWAHSFDSVVMADVLYHCEDFDDLIASILVCSKRSTTVYVAYEQRRRNLDSFFGSLEKHFLILSTTKYTVPSSSTGVLTELHIKIYVNNSSSNKA